METVAEPMGLGVRVRETREATHNLWGDAGVADIEARVGADTRAAFAFGAAVPRWVPERYFVEWFTAAFEGPCGGDTMRFAKLADEITECGFGRAKKLLLSLASPWLVLRRADALWRGEHTHGRLVVARLAENAARMVLSDHPFTETALLRDGISEAFRYILALSNAKSPVETHALVDGALHVHLHWS